MKLTATLCVLALANAAPVARRQWRQLSAEEKQTCVDPLAVTLGSARGAVPTTRWRQADPRRHRYNCAGTRTPTS